MLKSEGSAINGHNWSEPEEDFDDYDEDDSEQQLFMDANHILEILDEEEQPVQPQHIPEDLFLKDGVDTQIGAPGPYAKNFNQPQHDSEHPYGEGLTSGTNLSEDSQNSNPNNHLVNNVHLTNSTLSGSSGRSDDVCVAPDQLNQISAYPKNGYEYGDPGYAWLSKPTLEDQSYCQNSDEDFPIRGTFFCDDGFQNVASDMDGSPLSEQGCEKLVSHSEDLVDLTLSDSENEHEPARTKPQFPSYGENIELSRGFEDPSVSSKLAWMKNNRGFDIGPYVASDGEAGVLTGSNIISADSIGTSVGDLNPLSMERLSTSSLDISQHSQGRIHDVRQLNQEHSCNNFRVGEVDDDAELYVIEDISSRKSIAMPTFDRQSVSTLQHYPPVASFHGTESGVERLRINDERLTYRLALQNLSQARSETNPPDGVLTVPLLKHQRIALSWMVEKETASLHCSGGILADDQGLGKTISTIALILMERSPNSSVFVEDVKQQTEALDLDEDEEVLEPEDVKQIIESSDEGSNKRPKRNWKTFEPCKGRPSAGTLVVCPTSVLRQWGEELQNKVTDKAKLTVLIYHGSNRSRDPCEIAKYDVVITTYAIVSMEVPKQPLVDQDGNEEGHNYLSSEPSSSKKRKNYNDKKTNGKIQKASDGCLSESFDRPLAKVKWFRVVLDEAQSIKNHRTQVARACWGLRAKRRWCLSGTPIQNAIDDLYSYFRFLRYEPYAVYKLFCSNIKIPISKDPSNGYKKLQAVLKTVMLRRTKGTVLDGEPIIKLPPKLISLKKVNFSAEERLFYCRLEAESKAQFKVYADAGTVQQNYVNILLMLLRLRQACDHPVLVKYRDSDSADKSSLELTRKLPRERLIDLVTHLDAAICGICNDPPEDAVVAICGHVFCNQCVHQHLSSDDNLCPASNCRIQLNSSSIFSRATLFLSLSGDIAPHDTKESASKVSDDHSFQSSKIKAALEILQSLPKLSEQQLKSTRECFSSEVDSEAAYASKMEDSCVTAQPQTDSTDSDGSGTSYAHSMPATEKAIVFSQWTRMLDLLEAHLKKSGIKYRRLDGTMSVLARDKAVKDFNTLPEVSVMIMSLKAASLGLNMVAACHVLLLDLWWNPTTEDQAIDRAHRIGQTRPVIVSRLTVEGTVEDRILALQDKKREMVASAFGEDEKGRHQTRLTVEDLNYLFMGGGRG